KQRQRPEGLTDPQQLGAGVGIEAGPDREPVWERLDPSAAPTADLVELGRRGGDSRHRGVSLGGGEADLTLESVSALLVLRADAIEALHSRMYEIQFVPSTIAV